MALFLPILRLLLLFLNVYESYKTLKLPPPSSRNPARPSVRAMTQRKRDMKGCLAVWIVWVSLALYERVLESLISLFIPFYDEFKSLVLLFLIITRARGAEPIYLHLIRPIVKPHTRTLDSALELMLMVGDFLIALSTYPVQLAVQWWKRRFARFFEPFSFDADGSSNEVSPSDVSSSFFASSGQRPIPARGGDIRHLRKSSNGTSNENRRPYHSLNTHHKRGSSQEEVSPEVNQPSSSRQSSRSQTLPITDNNDLEIDSSTSPYQLWSPPAASYPEKGIGADIDRTLRPLVSLEVREETAIAEQQTDEWRQYPPFPSAYPPTPIAITSRLAQNSLGLASSMYPPIPEEVDSRQVFPRSPLPPRGPLNPSRAGDLGDHHYHHSGISQFFASDADDSISTDGYGNNEDEDEFDLTLRTPLQLNGSMRSRPRPTLLVSPLPISAASSNLSVPSRSSALSTADDGSPLRTDVWSDSSLSSVALNQYPASIVGKKRLHPRGGARRAEKRLDDYDMQRPSSSLHEGRSITPYSRPQARERLESVTTSDAADSIDDAHSMSSSELNNDKDDRQQILPKEKRRKVTKVLKSPRPVKSKTSRVSSPPHMRITSRKTRRSGGHQPLKVPEAPAKRRSRRLNAAGISEMEGITSSEH